MRRRSRRGSVSLFPTTQRDPAVAQRTIRSRSRVEKVTRSTSSALSRVQCPTLLMGGDEDPMIPIECQMDIAAALPVHLVRFERFPGCGHGVLTDAPEPAMALIRDFIVR